MSIKAKNEDPCKRLINLISNLKEPILLVAGPGTGKTTAIACRLKFLMEDENVEVSPDRILGVTFTNEAADEMERKLQRIGVTGIPKNICTLHSFAMRILSAACSKIGISSNFIVTYLEESELVAKEALSDVKNCNCKLSLRDAKKYQRAFQEKVSRGSQELEVYCSGIFVTDPILSKFERRYQELLRFYNALDWFEVIPLANYLLEDEKLRQRVQQLFDHIVVDEYQDLNLAEQKFINLIRNDNATLFVVGDDDQSVYESFRFANPEGMKLFKKRYSNAIIDTTTLNVSCRCPDVILRAALSLIGNNPDRIGKQISALRQDGNVYKQDKLGSKEKEAKWIAENIKKLHGHEQKVDYNRILVLFNIASIGHDYVKIIHENGIPVNDQLRKLNGLDTAEKKKLYFLLRLSINKEDGLAIRQLLALTPGVTVRAINKLRIFAEQNNLKLISALKQVVSECIEKSHFKLWHESLKNIYNLVHMLSEIDGSTPLCDRVKKIADLLGYSDLEFVKDLGSFIEQNTKLEVWQILEKFRNGKIVKPVTELKGTVVDDKVRFMTMHNAKGLDDVDVVFIPALEDSIIPGNRLEVEQRRMLYVAMTRAREAVFLSNAWSRTGEERYRAGSIQVIDRESSRFWDEIKT